MESALTLFAEYDYYRTTTAMVAKAAGVTQPYIFFISLTTKKTYT
ncbi:TetR family transcriptional regulator [Paenibacillus rhizoplanae]